MSIKLVPRDEVAKRKWVITVKPLLMVAPAARIGAACLVTMFAYSGARKLFQPVRCDKNQLSHLLDVACDDVLVRALLFGAGVWEVVASGIVYAWALQPSGPAAGWKKKRAVDSLLAFTVLVTLMFKIPKGRVIATLSNLSVAGGLMVLRDI